MVVPLQRKDAAEDLSSLYDEASEQEALAVLLEPRYMAMLNSVHELIVATFPTMEEFRLDDAATRAVLDHAAEQVVRIDETTRDALKDLLKIGQERGYSAWEIANGVPKDDYPGIEGLFKETWAGRAHTVARNELLEAQHTATMDRYRATGLVDRLRLRDGRDDAPCAARDGTTVPIDSRPERLHVNCLPGDQIVLAPNCRASSARWFEGEVIVIRTASDDFLTCTPNHPILTPSGWVPAQGLVEGDDVLRCIDSQRLAVSLDPYSDHRPSRIDDVARAFLPDHTATTQPLTAEDFHGDAADGDVCVIGTDGFLTDHRSVEHGDQFPLAGALVGEIALASQGTTARGCERVGHTTNSVMRSGGVGHSLNSGHASHAQTGGLVGRSGQPVLLEPIADRRIVDPEHRGDENRAQPLVHVQRSKRSLPRIERSTAVIPGRFELPMQSRGTDPSDGGDLVNALGSLVERVQIVQIRHVDFAHQVFNLQTDQGWYIAGNFITHNCTLVVIPILRGEPA